MKNITCFSIADGLGLLGDLIGAAMPTGGGVVSGAAKVLGLALKKHEYNKFQTRMSLIIEGRDTVELTDLARQVARELADRYEEQLLQLNEDFNEVPKVCCDCCAGLRCKNKDASSNETKPRRPKPAKIVAQFGVTFVINTILNEESEDIKISDDMTTIELAKSLVELICRAKPNITARARQRMHLGKKLILPLKNTTEEEKLSPWYLYDFYLKPAIRIKTDDGVIVNQNVLSWMNSDLYGYRLGTFEEYNYLVELDKNQNEITLKKNCCC